MLIDFTGEDPEYADTYGVYDVTVTAAPADYSALSARRRTPRAEVRRPLP